jgi:hypothetical protein
MSVLQITHLNDCIFVYDIWDVMVVEGKLEGRRGRGRPRLRWINDVEDDLMELGVKRWRTKALEREEWASIIKEAKVKLRGP